MDGRKNDWCVEPCFGEICSMLAMKLFGPLDIQVAGMGRRVLGSQAAAELIALLAEVGWTEQVHKKKQR